MVEKNEFNDVDLLDTINELHDRIDILTQILLDKKVLTKEELENKIENYFLKKENID